MKMVNRFLSGVAIGGVTNGILWGGSCASVLAFQEGTKKDLQNGWLFFMFLSWFFGGGFVGAIVGFFVTLINAGKIVSAIGGGLVAFVIIFFLIIDNGSTNKNLTLINLTFMPFVLSFFTASTCCLIVTVLNRWQTNEQN